MQSAMGGAPERERIVQEERARRSVQDAHDEDHHYWTVACERIARTMLKYL